MSTRAVEFRTVTTPVERIGAWLWWSIVAVLGTVGMIALHRDPARVRIEDFGALYQAIGLGDQSMIATLLTLPLAVAVTAAGLILAKRPADRTAVLLAVSLCSIAFFQSGAGLGLDSTMLRNASVSMSVVVIALFMVSFPSGRPEPSWAALVPVATLVATFLQPDLAARTRSLLVGSEPAPDLIIVSAVLWGPCIAIAITAQVVRYRRISTSQERRQTRWVMFGFAIVILPPVMLVVAMVLIAPTRAVIGGLVAISALGALAFPVTLAIAVFRHHLYDIDRIISRTLSYALVAGVLAVVYAVPVITLPSIVGGSSDLVVAGSTLAAAAVFSPVRRRIQAAVDRRFNRSRFDTESEVSRFTEGLSEATDIDDLTGELGALLDRTLAPASARVWIRESE